MRVFSKKGGKTILLRPVVMYLVYMAPDCDLLADKAAVVSAGSKVRVQDKHSSM